MSVTFTINEHLREFFSWHVDTFEAASATIRNEIAKAEPDLDVLDEALGSIQHDLNTLRHACAVERSASGVVGR